MVEDRPLHLRADFDTFVRSAYPGLVGVATALTGNLFDAEDMVHDTATELPRADCGFGFVGTRLVGNSGFDYVAIWRAPDRVWSDAAPNRCASCCRRSPHWRASNRSSADRRLIGG